MDNSTVKGGIELGVVNVDAQAGWDLTVQLQWEFAQRSRLCGSTKKGWLHSPQAEAHQPRVGGP